MPSQKKSRSNKNENNVAPEPEPVVAEPVAASEPVVESKQKKTKKSKVTEPVVAAPEVVAEPEPVVAEPVKQKGGKSKKPNVEPVAEPVAQPVAAPEPVKKSRKSKSNQPASEPVAPESAPVKQSRKPRQPKQQKNEEPVATTEPESEDPMDKTRSFKVMLPNDSDYTGRFTGLTPYQAANKALSKYFRNSDNTNITEDFIFFSIKESTRRSKRNVYNYKGARVKLATPIEYKIKSENGEERVITKQYKNQLVKVKKSVEAKSETVTTTA